jgi:type IV pilus assembly protein PilM
MATSIVGVDIGATTARAVEVSGYDGGKPVVTRMHHVPLPENSVRRGEVVELATVSSALKRLWSTGGFKAKNVVLGMGGSRVFARDFTTPKQSLSQIRESLPFQVQDMLPVPTADVLLDFYPVQEEDGEQGTMIKGLLVAGLKDAITANVSAVMTAGLMPKHVDLIPFAISRALAPVRAPRGPEVIVAIGANTTNVVVVDRGVPQFVRIIPNGGDDITRAIATRFQWAPEQAEQAKRAIGMGGPMMRAEDRPVLEVIYEVAGELLSSIRSTLSYYTGTSPSEQPQRILLIGGGAQMIGLPNALQDVTGLSVTVAEPLASVGLPRNKKAERPSRERLDSYTTAFGLALGSHA